MDQPIDKERLKRIDELLRQAMELEGESRAEFLYRACAGDVELRREVEQMLGDALDALTDVFSLGLVVYEIIAGRHPYIGKSDEEIIAALKSDDEIPSVSALNDRIPAALDRIVSKALRKNRDERYASAGEMRDDLEELKSLAEVVHKDKGERLFKTRNANQLLTQFAALYDADKTARISLGSLWTIWRFADLKRGALEREALRKSLLSGLARAWRWILLIAALTMVVTAPMSVVEVWIEQMVRDGHKSAARRMAFSPDGRLLATSGVDRQVIIWDFARRERVETLSEHNDIVGALAFAPNGKWLATGSHDQRLIVWDTGSWRKVKEVSVQEGRVSAAEFSPDGSLLAANILGASTTAYTLLWRTSDWLQVGKLPIAAHGTARLLFTRDGKRMIFTDFLGATPCAWDVTTGKSLVTGGDDGSAIIWDRASLRKQTILTGHEDSVRELIFPPQGGVMATVDGTATVRLWDIARRKSQEELRLKKPDNDEYNMTDSALSPDLRWSVTRFAVHGRASGRIVCDNQTISDYGFSAAAFSSDGRYLIGIGVNKLVSLLETGTWRMLAQRQEAELDGVRVCFSPDGERLAIGDGDGPVWLWSVNPLRSLGQLGKHQAFVDAVAFSPDGSRVASASDDRTICLWDVGSRKLITRIGEHTSAINSIAFSPDGRQLLSGEHDGTVRLYTRHRKLWGFSLD